MFQKCLNPSLPPSDSSTKTGGPSSQKHLMGTRSDSTMRVHAHTKFCFLCVLTFLFHQCNHCHGKDHSSHNAHSDLQISEAPYMKGATASPQSNSHHEDSLEEEQRFYIEQLFRRYGQKEQLDFQGFQSLLFSLGLGEVKLVEVDHEHLGHDHVAHLDLIDMQEGLHSHSSANEGHDHSHGHRHVDPHHKPGSHHLGTEQSPTGCSQQTSAASPTAGASTGDDSIDIPPINLGEQEASVPSRSSQLPPELHITIAPTESPTQRPRNKTRVRGQHGRNKTLSPLTSQLDNHNKQSQSSNHGHRHSHGHSHKERREAPGEPAATTLPVPLLPGHPGGPLHQHEECLNLTQLLNYYGLSPDSLISPSQFTYLCPALLYQIDSRVCIRHYHQVDVEQKPVEAVSSVWVWVWGFVSITIISLLSLLGVVLVPILNQSCFKYLLTFLVALAVGTLSGDALLHLLPHSQGQHDHSEPQSSHDTDLLTTFDGVWKGLTALSGIYLLFIIEHCIGMFKHYKDRRGTKRKAIEGEKIGRKLSDHKLNRRSDAEWLHLKSLNEDPESTAPSCDNGYNDTQLTELQMPESPSKNTPLAPANPEQEPLSPTRENGRKSKQHSHRHSHGHGHSHGGNCHSDQEMKDAGIASIAWMVIMGDGMHNFSDGLAIGAAFSANLTGGISTSVAVFCHELPHELGDFAVLLKAGMTVKQAIVYNVLSALMAYIGMMIGTVVGQNTHNVTNWIFAITAGMFLYVALVDMLPEMLHGDSEDHKRCRLGHFVLQNVGMLTGFSIMLLIAIFEDQIVFDFGF